MNRAASKETDQKHGDVIKWKHFPRYWPFVRGIHRSPVKALRKGQWRGALMFSLIYAWTNGISNHRRFDCVLNRLFRRRSMKTWKIHVTGLCEGNSPVTGEFPAQRPVTRIFFSIWWRHHEQSCTLNHQYNAVSWLAVISIQMTSSQDDEDSQARWSLLRVQMLWQSEADLSPTAKIETKLEVNYRMIIIFIIPLTFGLNLRW